MVCLTDAGPIAPSPLASLVPAQGRTRPATSTMPAQSIDIAAVWGERVTTHWRGLARRRRSWDQLMIVAEDGAGPRQSWPIPPRPCGPE